MHTYLILHRSNNRILDTLFVAKKLIVVIFGFSVKIKVAKFRNP